MARPKGKRVVGADGTFTVAGKAANGEGSTFYRPDKGRWVARFRDPATGKTRSVMAATRAEAEKRRDERVAELAAATPSGRLGTNPTVGELADWWLDNVAAVTVRPSTLHTYRKDCTRIAEHLGALPLADFDAEAVRLFLAALRRQGLAASTTRNARTRLRQVAQQAVELGYLAGNPVSAVRAPAETAEERTTRRALTPDETRRLLASLDGSHPLDAAVALLFTAGLRVSEVLGLAWSDLDLDAGTATIRRACTYTGGGIGARLDRPKTAGTAGIHHLAPTAVGLLRKRKVQQAAEHLAAGPAWETVTYEGQQIDLCFTTSVGGLMVRQPVYTRLRKAAKAVGIDTDRLGTHTGRRSAVTALFAAGVAVDDIARHVGHASPETTSRYVADLGTRPADTAALAARLLDPAARSTAVEG